jgi:hypothetical protein
MFLLEINNNGTNTSLATDTILIYIGHHHDSTENPTNICLYYVICRKFWMGTSLVALVRSSLRLYHHDELRLPDDVGEGGARDPQPLEDFVEYGDVRIINIWIWG